MEQSKIIDTLETYQWAPTIVVLSLTVEWGVGMERQGPSYGEVVSTRMYEFRPFSEEVTALRLGARRRSSGL